jgi:uncharacterized membrane protein
MERSTQRWHTENPEEHKVKAHERGFERLIFFSDAVMAIAITLLVLEIRLPDTLPAGGLREALLSLGPRYVAFAVSFFVIGLFWLGHHRMLTSVHGYDRGFMWVNLVFLFLIAFMPFPTAVLGRFGADELAVDFYAIEVGLASLARTFIWVYAVKRGLTTPGLSGRAVRREMYLGFGPSAIFFISVGVAAASPLAGMYSWFALVPLLLTVGRGRQ